MGPHTSGIGKHCVQLIFGPELTCGIPAASSVYCRDEWNYCNSAHLERLSFWSQIHLTLFLKQLGPIHTWHFRITDGIAVILPAIPNRMTIGAKCAVRVWVLFILNGTLRDFALIVLQQNHAALQEIAGNRDFKNCVKHMAQKGVGDNMNRAAL